MKRRNFTQTILTGLSLSCIPMSISMAAKPTIHALLSNEKVTTSDGLELRLTNKVHPTKNKDSKQFILSYDVKNSIGILEEKIYDIKVAGEAHQVYMTPVADNQLQAVFNWRLNA